MRLYEHVRTGGIATVGLVVTLDMGGGIEARLALTGAGWMVMTFVYTGERSEAG
jgi:hypothetical protein